jgi:hypothetical protein
MTERLHGSSDNQAEVQAFLSGAFQRIQSITIVLAVTAAIAATLLFGWRSALGTVIGSFVAYANLIWLHHGSAMMIERLLASLNKTKAKPPSKLPLILSFTGRYVFVIAIAYVILRGFPSMLLGFVVALFFPILAAMCEGVYEACVNIKINKTRDETSLH